MIQIAKMDFYSELLKFIKSKRFIKKQVIMRADYNLSHFNGQ